MLMPWGEVTTENGDFVVNEESAKRILAEWNRRKTDIVVDFEHQTQGGAYSSPDGTAPAAGWIRFPQGLEIVPGRGIFATVEWTPRASEMIARREYRFLSPVVMVRNDDRVVVNLLSVALTNTPAIHGLQPIVAKASADERRKDRMTEETTVAELKAKLAQAEDGLRQLEMRARTLEAFERSVLAQLDLKDGATPKEIEERIVALKKPASDVEVLRAKNAELAERLDKLAADLAERDADAFIEKLCLAAKISTDDEKKYWRAFFLADRGRAEAGAALLAAKVPVGKTEAPTETAAPDREKIIAKASREYDGLVPALKGLTTKKAWVNQALREASLDTLRDEEAHRLSA